MRERYEHEYGGVRKQRLVPLTRSLCSLPSNDDIGQRAMRIAPVMRVLNQNPSDVQVANLDAESADAAINPQKGTHIRYISTWAMVMAGLSIIFYVADIGSDIALAFVDLYYGKTFNFVYVMTVVVIAYFCQLFDDDLRDYENPFKDFSSTMTHMWKVLIRPVVKNRVLIDTYFRQIRNPGVNRGTAALALRSREKAALCSHYEATIDSTLQIVLQTSIFVTYMTDYSGPYQSVDKQAWRLGPYECFRLAVLTVSVISVSTAQVNYCGIFMKMLSIQYPYQFSEPGFFKTQFYIYSMAFKHMLHIIIRITIFALLLSCSRIVFVIYIVSFWLCLAIYFHWYLDHIGARRYRSCQSPFLIAAPQVITYVPRKIGTPPIWINYFSVHFALTTHNCMALGFIYYCGFFSGKFFANACFFLLSALIVAHLISLLYHILQDSLGNWFAVFYTNV